MLDNFRRQRLPLRPLIVANGRAQGIREIPGCTVVTSTAHQSAAKNEGLEYARRHGGGFFAIFDDDDWYGPGYLAELAENAHRATVVGKRRHFVHLSDGLYLFDEAGANKPSEWVTGACTAGWVEDAVQFPCWIDRGEDAEWCNTMTARGATFWATSIWDFIYDHRGAGHAWNASDIIVRRTLGSARRFNQYPESEFVPTPTNDQIFTSMASVQ